MTVRMTCDADAITSTTNPWVATARASTWRWTVCEQPCGGCGSASGPGLVPKSSLHTGSDLVPILLVGPQVGLPTCANLDDQFAIVPALYADAFFLLEGPCRTV